MRFGGKKPLVLGERRLDLGVLRKHRAVDDPEALGGLALGRQIIADPVFGHDPRGFLRQRQPQILAAHRDVACSSSVRFAPYFKRSDRSVPVPSAVVGVAPSSPGYAARGQMIHHEYFGHRRRDSRRSRASPCRARCAAE